MLTGRNVARIAALAALLGFVLPWVLVSCAGEPVGRLTGIDLATGGGQAAAGGGGHPNLWVALSLVATVGGIVASFLARGRRAILAGMAAAIVALLASAIGISSVTSAAPAEPPRLSPGAGAPAVDPSIGKVELQYGYLITVAGLLIAIGAYGAALAGRNDDPA